MDTEFINSIKEYVFSTVCFVYLDIVENIEDDDMDVDLYFLSIEVVQQYLNENYHKYCKKESKTFEKIFNKILGFGKIKGIVCLTKVFNFLSIELITNTILHIDAITIMKNMDVNSRLKLISKNLHHSLFNDNCPRYVLLENFVVDFNYKKSW